MLNPLLKELLTCIDDIEEIACMPYMESEDYEKLDNSRNRSHEIIKELQELLDK